MQNLRKEKHLTATKLVQMFKFMGKDKVFDMYSFKHDKPLVFMGDSGKFTYVIAPLKLLTKWEMR